MNIVEAVGDERLFKPFFRDLGTWGAWLTFLRALYGLPPAGESDLALFREATGREAWPGSASRESYIIAGRRSGKSTICALLACHLAFLCDWRPYLSKGEKGYIFLIAVNKNQAAILKNYIEGIIETQKMFRTAVRRRLAEEIELKGGVTLRVVPSSFRSVRGFTLLGCVLEELSFWRYEEAAEPDVEVVRALRPGLIDAPDSRLIGISSPFAKAGFLYEQYSKWHGKPGGPLVWRLPTERMNPTYSAGAIRAAYEDDPIAAASEFGAEWRPDISSFADPEVIDACVAPGRHGLDVLEGISYFAFIDPSGGREDSFTLAVAHFDAGAGRAVLDCAIERRPPFRPEDVVAEYAETLKRYRLTRAQADSYAGEWVPSAFRNFNITIERSPKTKSEIYGEFLPLLQNGRVELLDNRRLLMQLKSLDRRTRGGGRDAIDSFHGSDDVSNVVAGALCLASKGPQRPGRVYIGGVRVGSGKTTADGTPLL